MQQCVALRRDCVPVQAVVVVDVDVGLSRRRQQQRGVDQVAKSAGGVGVLGTDQIVRVDGVLRLHPSAGKRAGDAAIRLGDVIPTVEHLEADGLEFPCGQRGTSAKVPVGNRIHEQQRA